MYMTRRRYLDSPSQSSSQSSNPWTEDGGVCRRAHGHHLRCRAEEEVPDREQEEEYSTHERVRREPVLQSPVCDSRGSTPCEHRPHRDAKWCHCAGCVAAEGHRPVREQG